MPRHRRGRVGPWVRRATYMALWRRYEALLADYHALERDNALLIADAQDGVAVTDPAPAKHIPSWAETQEIPVITSVGTAGLDPDKATALVHRGGLLDSPSGEWAVPQPGTSG